MVFLDFRHLAIEIFKRVARPELLDLSQPLASGIFVDIEEGL